MIINSFYNFFFQSNIQKRIVQLYSRFPACFKVSIFVISVCIYSKRIKQNICEKPKIKTINLIKSSSKKIEIYNHIPFSKRVI